MQVRERQLVLEHCQEIMDDSVVVGDNQKNDLKAKQPGDDNGIEMIDMEDVSKQTANGKLDEDGDGMENGVESGIEIGTGNETDGCSSIGVEENGLMSEMSSESLPSSPLLPSSPECSTDDGTTEDGGEKPKSLNLEKKTPRFNIEKVKSPTPSSEHPSLHQQNSITHDADTIGYATHEAVPLTMFYRNENTQAGKSKARPTLAELQKGFDELDEQQDNEAPLLEPKDVVAVESPPKVAVSQTMKFGWVKGVLVPCLLNIWGVILYLRLPWLTGQSGVFLVTAIILLSACVTTITTMSMSAICTNGEVKGGGAYYLISRSLGPEFGGSIGIIFSLANAIGVALYVVGFSETVQQMMARNDLVIVDKLNDIRIIGIVVVIVLLGITLIGLSWVIRTQLILLLILVLSMVDYAIGTFTGPLLVERELAQHRGFTSYTSQTFTSNLLPEFRGENFFSTFSIFFPAATGILAGVNISGDLKDPQSAIPKGTFSAILLTTVVYILLAWLIGGSTVKDAPLGVVVGLAGSGGNATVPALNVTSVVSMVTSNTTAAPVPVSCIPNCKYGLLNDYQLMERMSMMRYLVLAGIFAATLSSALASLVGSPKTFQAVCRDKIFQGLEFFGHGSGPNEEPRRAYVLTFFISTAFILIGQLDLIAPVISNFFLMSYALINYSVFAASLGKSPGWRPSFKYYNMWLSLLGTALCVGIMFLINWWAALVTMVIVMSLYKYVAFKKPQINWGSSGQAHTYVKALKLAHQLDKTETHVKNFRPQCLVLTGQLTGNSSSSRQHLAHFVSSLTKHVGLMISGQVVLRTVDATTGSPDVSTTRQEAWLKQHHIKSFAVVTSAGSIRQGAQALMQCAGLGKLRPNIVVLGFKHDWRSDDVTKVEDYINIVHDAFDNNLSVAILRTPKDAVIDEYEDYEEEYKENLNLEELAVAFGCENGVDANQPIEYDFEAQDIPRNASNSALCASNNAIPASNTPIQMSPSVHALSPSMNHIGNQGITMTPQMTPATPLHSSRGSKKAQVDQRNSNMGREQRNSSLKERTGDIDVWWLYDDGGLTILLPYLISQNKKWKGCSLRILTPASDKKKNVKSNQLRMANLLKKFRITFSGIVEVEGINSKPSQQSIDDFFSCPPTQEGEDLAPGEPMYKKTLRQIRFGELLREHSSQAQLVVVTMPIGRKTVVSNRLYMAWLEAISCGLDTQILLVRGNQTSVLTFYS